MPEGPQDRPLVAGDRATAEVVLSALLASAGGGEIFLDVQASTATRSPWRKTGSHAGIRDGAHVCRRDPAVAAGAGIRRHHL